MAALQVRERPGLLMRRWFSNAAAGSFAVGAVRGGVPIVIGLHGQSRGHRGPNRAQWSREPRAVCDGGVTRCSVVDRHGHTVSTTHPPTGTRLRPLPSTEIAGSSADKHRP